MFSYKYYMNIITGTKKDDLCICIVERKKNRAVVYMYGNRDEEIHFVF